MDEKNEEGVRTVDALTEEEFLKLVINTLESTKELKDLGVMELALSVARATVRLAYDRKVVVVRKP